MATHDHAPATAPRAHAATLLRTLRERALLSQEELAQRSGLSVGTIRGLEGGRTRRPHGASLRRLVDALGLTEAEGAALVTAVRGGTAETGTDRPAQLPATVMGFAGRADALKTLDELLPADVDGSPAATVIATIAGTAGVGKTTLAVHWAHRVAHQFPDGQLYVDLRGFHPSGSPVDPAVAVHGFLDALALPSQRSPAEPEAQVRLYRSLLAGRRMLILLDNARDAEQVRPLLPGTPGCLVLVTSRDELAGLVAIEGARALTLDLLTNFEAGQLLAQRLGAQRVAAEPGAIDEIIVRCARLPLALAVVAARAATRPDFPLAVLASQLREALGGLGAFADTDAGTDVRAVFSWSYHRLTRAAATLFRQLGLHPGPDLTAAAAASLAGVSPERGRILLTELARAHLVIERSPGRYACHDLLRAYASELADTTDTESVRRQALLRMLDHYLHTAHAAAMLVNPHRPPIDLTPLHPEVSPEPIATDDQALSWFTGEYRVLLAAIELTAQGFEPYTWALAWTLTNFLDRQGHWQEWVDAHRIAVDAAARLDDRVGLARAYHGLGRACSRLGRYAEAASHLTRSLDLFYEAGDRTGQALNHIALGQTYERRRNYRPGLDHARRALDLFRAVDDRAGQAAALNDIGWYSAQLGDYQQAVDRCRQALALQEAVGDRYSQAHTWDSLGYAYHHLGRPRDATDCYARALQMFHDLGDRFYEADTLIHLGDTYQADNAPDAASDAWRQALTILDELDHPLADAVRARLTQPSGPRRTL